MKILLAAVNAKYIHSNLGIYSLKSYAEERLLKKAQNRRALDCWENVQIDLAEYTINQRPDEILQDIYKQNPQVLGF